MRSIQTNPMIFMSDRLSVAFSFSRRAHLLTTRKRAVVCLRHRALSEEDAASAEAYGQCHISGSMLSSATQLSQIWADSQRCMTASGV